MEQLGSHRKDFHEILLPLLILLLLLLFVGPAGTPPIALQPSRPLVGYSKPYFSSPVHLQRRFTPDGVRDLY
jgi:hypothetical protein